MKCDFENPREMQTIDGVSGRSMICLNPESVNYMQYCKKYCHDKKEMAPIIKSIILPTNADTELVYKIIDFCEKNKLEFIYSYDEPGVDYESLDLKRLDDLRKKLGVKKIPKWVFQE